MAARQFMPPTIRRPKMLSFKIAVALGLTAALAMGTAVSGQTSSTSQISQGRALAVRKCSGCHAIALTDVSPNLRAPAFRNLYKRYPVDGLREAFLKGYRVAHAPMPKFVLPRTKIDPLLAYLKSLNPCSARSTDRAAMRRCFEPL